MNQLKCNDKDLMKPAYDSGKKELTIPCTMRVAEQLILESKFEFATIKTNQKKKKCELCGEVATKKLLKSARFYSYIYVCQTHFDKQNRIDEIQEEQTESSIKGHVYP